MGVRARQDNHLLRHCAVRDSPAGVVVHTHTRNPQPAPPWLSPEVPREDGTTS
jgi:hypothetical protein